MPRAPIFARHTERAGEFITQGELWRVDPCDIVWLDIQTADIWLDLEDPYKKKAARAALDHHDEVMARFQADNF